MPSFAHRTLEELPTNAQENVTTGKQQEEGFTGGLPARNARTFRHGPAPAVGTQLSRGVAVDNLWITMGLIHSPTNAFNGRLTGVGAFWLPYPIPRPENAATGRKTGLPGIVRAKKNPRMAGEEKPHGLYRGAVDFYWLLAMPRPAVSLFHARAQCRLG